MEQDVVKVTVVKAKPIPPPPDRVLVEMSWEQARALAAMSWGMTHARIDENHQTGSLARGEFTVSCYEQYYPVPDGVSSVEVPARMRAALYTLGVSLRKTFGIT